VTQEVKKSQAKPAGKKPVEDEVAFLDKIIKQNQEEQKGLSVYH